MSLACYGTKNLILYWLIFETNTEWNIWRILELMARSILPELNAKENPSYSVISKNRLPLY
jgi:hypothetical protein